MTQIRSKCHFNALPVSAVCRLCTSTGAQRRRWSCARSVIPHLPPIPLPLALNFFILFLLFLSSSLKDEKALLKCRKIVFAGKFEPVKWSCRAPLPSGRLCPRRDRLKVHVYMQWRMLFIAKLIYNMGNMWHLEYAHTYSRCKQNVYKIIHRTCFNQ